MTDRAITTNNTTGPRWNAGGVGTYADSCIVFFGAWTLIHQLSYFAGLTFRQAWSLAWAGAAAGVYCSWITRGPADEHRRAGETVHVYWALLAAVAIAIAVTLCSIRPDADDEAYIGFALLGLDNLARPMKSVPYLDTGYAMTTYDFLRASLSAASGIPLLVSYYLVWPAIIAGLLVVFQWRLFRLLNVRHLALALLSLFVVMLFWGDAHRTPANLGFVRLFQGKGPLVWVAVPAAWLYWMKFVAHGDARPLVLLFLAVAAGIGFSPSGVTIGVLLLALFIAASLIGSRFKPDVRVLTGLLLVLAYAVATGLTMRLYFGHSATSIGDTSGEPQAFTYTSAMIVFVLGNGLRAVVALACAAALPAAMRVSPSRRALSIYSMLCTGLLIFPWTSHWLGTWGYATTSWRWLYAVPFTPSMILALDRFDDLRAPSAIRWTMAAVALLLYVFISPAWVMSKANSTALSVPSYKLADPALVYVRQYRTNARVDGAWIVSPATGRRY